LPGLFAAGETACVSINGANRLGSNSLTELLVFGARAGLAAARFTRESPELDMRSAAQQGAEEEERITRHFLRKEGGSERLAALRAEMRTAMESGAGIYRSEASLRHTCEKLEELRERFADVRVEDASLTFNTQLTTALELDCMLDVARTVAHSALAREESRGSHQRTDYPDRDDENFLRHSLAFRSEEGGIRIGYRDVVITRWEPAERIYGKVEVER
ncbi:MAG TPA: FAD-binding protein, partial [Longimicrobiaceae bacterium]|nr:FAD-binding protein [Longimicrobiaceae bacterium]